MNITTIEGFMRHTQKSVRKWINLNIKAENIQEEKLYEAMLYSLNAGGKCLRPALLMLSYNLASKIFHVPESHPVLTYACAAELIHTYSLIHDDLPAMDNDSLRRGKPTNHTVFGEAAAILAGDALLTKGIEIFISTRIGFKIDKELQQRSLCEILKAIGPDGMIAGQYVDIEYTGKKIGFERQELVRYIHKNKTAAFMSACCAAGAILGGYRMEEVKRVANYGLNLGMAFQIMDDVADATSTTEEMGKDAGSDESKGKLTFVKVYGVKHSRSFAESYIKEALLAIQKLRGNKKMLEDIAMRVIKRRAKS